MVRINRVYTKTGDDGTTALVGGERVSKDDARIEAYGTVDELNAVIGMARHALQTSGAGIALLPVLKRVQNELFNLGAELATPDEWRKVPAIAERHVTKLEEEMDASNAELPELRSFILPGGGESATILHLARTVCRRAERRVITLSREGRVSALSIKYLNRLSDALFVWSRWTALIDDVPEELWEPEKT